MRKQRFQKPRVSPKTTLPIDPGEKFLSEAKRSRRANIRYKLFLADPFFHSALQEIRAQFGITEGASAEEREAWERKQYGAWGYCQLKESPKRYGETWKYWQEFPPPQMNWKWVEKILKTDLAFHRFQEAVKRFENTMLRNHKLSVAVHWKIVHPFEHAVEQVLRGLGLSMDNRNFFIQRLWGVHGRVSFVPPSLVGPISHNADGTLRQAVLTVTPYDSDRDVADAFRWVKSLGKPVSKTHSRRPPKPDADLRIYLLEQVIENGRRPKEERQRRKLLMKTLWQKSHAEGLHKLSEASFRRVFYNALKGHNLVKRYVRE